MDNIRCHHEKYADIRYHDGSLPHVAGACSYQVVRACADKNKSPEGEGFTYNHAPMLAYWNDTFFYEYLGGPKGEHETPSMVFLCTSKDGITWSKPITVFPSKEERCEFYRGPGKELIKGEKVPLVVHHRMGFYTSTSGRLLISTFYGISPSPEIAPNSGFGVGRAVREIYKDMTMSEIYFIHYNEAAGYNEKNTHIFSSYKKSNDAGFIEACDELLNNRLVIQQWWEEERFNTELFSRSDGKALSYYTLPDGSVMGVFKAAMTSLSMDNGKTWSQLEKSPSIITSTGKVWGQKTNDGKYALVYNPSPDSAHRWPLAITTGENGRDFYNLAAVFPEISPCRYEGIYKNLGAQYIRGITEANDKPKENAIYLAFSVNKEDMWITRVPVPVNTEVKGDIHDDMSIMTDKMLRNTWNLYVPSWGNAILKNINGTRELYLFDKDPYNRTLAERIFEKTQSADIYLSMKVYEVNDDVLSFTVTDDGGQNIFKVFFDSNRQIMVHSMGLNISAGRYEFGKKINIKVSIDIINYSYNLQIDTEGNTYHKKGNIMSAVKNAQRLVIATKEHLPFQGLEDNGKYGNIGNLRDADTEIKGNCAAVEKIDISIKRGQV